jgi:8-hydroxy-5-deazaflavin:NADPH oxidoreductase
MSWWPADDNQRMRIAVIGTGNVGGAVGRAWARAGHDVTFGSRHPDGSDVGGAPVAAIADALDGAEVVLLALPGGAAVDGFLAEHAAAVGGRLVLDATNRVGAPVVNAAAQIAAAAPNARYVRAFNSLGWENFVEPTFDGVAADLFFSGSPLDRETVEGLISDVGLRPAYLGADQHAVVDGVVLLWFTLVQARGGNRHLAFRVLSD